MRARPDFQARPARETTFAGDWDEAQRSVVLVQHHFSTSNITPNVFEGIGHEPCCRLDAGSASPEG